jgi:SAM-dependent methyltransferase
MFGSGIFGKKEVVSAILEHTSFAKRTNPLVKALAKVLGQLYIRLFGWPDQEIRTTFPKMVKLLKPSSTDSILDVGCGPGVWALEMASRYNCSVTGIDLDADDIRFADKVSRIHHMDGCHFTCMDVTELNFEPESFDKVTCMAVLEHVEEDDLAVRNMARVLRQNGVLVGLVPNDRRSLFKPECWQGSDDPKGHGHVREGYSVQDVENLMNRNGLQLVKYEYPHGLIETTMCNVQIKTNPYLTFPLTYPITHIFERFSSSGCGILFKAVKKSSEKVEENEKDK